MLPLNLPSIVDEVARQEALVGAFLDAAGLMFMILGIRLSRLLIGLSFGVVGFVLGGSMGGPEDVRIALGMVVALALAI
ncbi:MAG: hypothetical protein HY718_05180, partial [Planctomycetes bacterium]|nr:hypothetical protein [Planctomycetota bacterium]